jgi:hypothetical protein
MREVSTCYRQILPLRRRNLKLGNAMSEGASNILMSDRRDGPGALNLVALYSFLGVIAGRLEEAPGLGVNGCLELLNEI